MICQRTMLAVAAVGICIVVSGFVLYDAGLLGVQHVIVIGLQVNPWDTEFMTKASDMIFEGTVKSTEIKHVYEPSITRSPEEHKRIVKERADIIMNITGEPIPPSNYERPILPNGDLLIKPDRHVPYNYVTVQVTEWLKDSTGQYADQVIVRDYTTGAIGKVNGEPAWFEYRDAVGYSDGEKGIFFAGDIDGELATHGALSVFRYDENGRVYLPYSVDRMKPFVEDELKADIRAKERAPYAAIAGAEPVFEPRIVEPLVDPPDIRDALGYIAGYPYGYSAAEHVPEDDSVILTFEDPAGTGRMHAQRYEPGQTFAYACPDFFGRMHMYQYMGTSLYQEVRSLVLLQFEVDAPDVPCIFPDYLVHTVDLYDAGRLGAPAGTGAGQAGHNRTTYADHIGSAVITTAIYVDPYPVRPHGGEPYTRPGDIRLLPDGSIDVTFSDGDNSTRAYSANYMPGQTFASSCTEAGDVTYLYVYQYRGTEEFRGSKDMMMVNFAVHTQVPVPCTYPDFIMHSTDALDMGWFDGRYEEEVQWLASTLDPPGPPRPTA